MRLRLRDSCESALESWDAISSRGPDSRCSTSCSRTAAARIDSSSRPFAFKPKAGYETHERSRLWNLCRRKHLAEDPFGPGGIAFLLAPVPGGVFANPERLS